MTILIYEMSQLENSSSQSGGDHDEESLTRKLYETTHELTYRSLQSSDCRLLVLYPGSAPDPVRCAFIHTDLSDPFCYEAISYAWGSPTPTHLVFSTSGHSSIPVTASADSALKAVRYAHKRRVLWIDGLCINQRDEVEKAQQVGIMGRIYGKAERTLVYLGEDEDDDFAYTAYTLRCLQRHHEPGVPLEEQHALKRALKEVDFEHNETLDHMVYAAYLARDMEYGSQDAFEPLLAFRRSFFARRWFKRLWIMQEVALSKQVIFHFAGQAIPWGTIMAFYNELDFWFHQRDQKFYGHPIVSDRSILGTKVVQQFGSSDRTTGPTGFDFAGEFVALRHRIAAFDQPEEYYGEGQGPLSIQRHLIDLMYEMRHFRCGDPRDRLYAILSMFDEEIPLPLQPDYTPSTSASKVFSNISRCLISKGTFDVLAAAQGLPAHGTDLPSWAVNWEDPPDRERLFTAKNLGGDVQVGTKAGMAPMRPSGVLQTADNSIVLRGMALGKLTYVGPACPLDADDETFQRVYSCWIWWNKYIHSLDELGMSRSQLPTPDSIAGSDILPLDHVSQDPYYLIPDSAVNRDIRDRSFKEHCQGRAFATVGHVDWDGDWERSDDLGWSANNAKCLVPSSAEVGDLLCGLLGFEIAVVLRPAGRGGYRFVGTSSCWKLAIAKAAPGLDWDNLRSELPQTPLQDFSIY